jgi:hypothetical protein
MLLSTILITTPITDGEGPLAHRHVAGDQS